jgi:ubiquinone/menaquinone biosynthesis C-methylase UbiE
MHEGSEHSKDVVRERFARAAEGYASDVILAEGEELAAMVAAAALGGGERVLDVATGAGHTALAFAPHVAEVVATDLTPEMLAAARRLSERRGLVNVRFEVADAEALPSPDASFDVVTARFAPHHFPHPDRFCAQARRVLRRGGRLVLFDNMAPEDDELDEFINRVERRRDPGHHRAHRISEWTAMLTNAGFQVSASPPLTRKVYEYDGWTARQHLPEDEKQALARWLLQAPPRCADYFAITADGDRMVSLEATFGLVTATAPAGT